MIFPVIFVLQIISFFTVSIRDWYKIGEVQKMEGID